MRVAVQRGAVFAPFSREKRQMGVCVCVNVLCGIVKRNSCKKPLSVFSPQRERYFLEIQREKGEGNLFE